MRSIPSGLNRRFLETAAVITSNGGRNVCPIHRVNNSLVQAAKGAFGSSRMNHRVYRVRIVATY